MRLNLGLKIGPLLLKIDRVFFLKIAGFRLNIGWGGVDIPDIALKIGLAIASNLIAISTIRTIYTIPGYALYIQEPI